jgi:hypothetical protein
MLLHSDDEISIDRVLGHLSTQRIFFTLVTWEKLTSNDIIAKTELSDSIIFQTLKSLTALNLVKKVSRGYYSLNTTPSTEHLKKFYLQILIEFVGGEIYKLSKNIETHPIEESSRQFDELLLKWQPIVEEHYSFRVSSLAEAIISKTVYGDNVAHK